MKDKNPIGESTVKWCCSGFRENYYQAGQRGIGILVGLDFGDRPQFTLQFRAIEKGNEQSVSSEEPVSLIVDVGLQYCPWCGGDLEKWYGDVAEILYRPDLKITY